MSHLGDRVSPLVDGQLDADAAERALIHITGCAECHDAVEIERLTKRRLATLGVPLPGNDFMHRLLEMSGPCGPMPPRPGHVPGNPRPQFTSASGGSALGGNQVSAGLAGGLLITEPGRAGGTGVGLRPPGRRGSSRPSLARPASTSRLVRVGRSSRTRMAAAMVGAVCLVGAGVAGGVANGGVVDQRVVPPVDSFVLEHSATTGTLPFNDQTVLWKAVGAGR
jgi:anti-sigma factor RsiW